MSQQRMTEQVQENKARDSFSIKNFVFLEPWEQQKNEYHRKFSVSLLWLMSMGGALGGSFVGLVLGFVLGLPFGGGGGVVAAVLGGGIGFAVDSVIGVTLGKGMVFFYQKVFVEVAEKKKIKPNRKSSQGKNKFALICQDISTKTPSNGVQADSRDTKSPKQILLEAIKAANLAVFTETLQANISILDLNEEFTCRKGKTFAHIAAERWLGALLADKKPLKAIIKSLMAHNADFNIKDNEGNTACVTLGVHWNKWLREIENERQTKITIEKENQSDSDLEEDGTKYGMRS